MCAIAIRFPMEYLNDIAQKEGMEIPVTICNSNIILKVPFETKNQGYYNSFFATEKQECMIELLAEQIDFDQYVA